MENFEDCIWLLFSSYPHSLVVLLFVEAVKELKMNKEKNRDTFNPLNRDTVKKLFSRFTTILWCGNVFLNQKK